MGNRQRIINKLGDRGSGPGLTETTFQAVLFLQWGSQTPNPVLWVMMGGPQQTDVPLVSDSITTGQGPGSHGRVRDDDRQSMILSDWVLAFHRFSSDSLAVARPRRGVQ
ncbi:hypothetical protein PG991_005368 [Apiospora marii]|uniref:Uncharacterized protein n=1 Tax=Apiospora marii TaxID=335849 RepID=A0ABR1S8Y6_9PEZI